ncbi:MAG: hypothetical protein OXT67_04735 [Zetaproteobacteria bacterium]|nr:hypothetical protein [Zetaproteobacteria bacterium]
MLQRIVALYWCLGSVYAGATDVSPYLRAVQALKPHQQVQLAETGLSIAQMDPQELVRLRSSMLFQGDRLNLDVVVSVQRWQDFLAQTLAVVLGQHIEKPSYRDYYLEAWENGLHRGSRYHRYTVEEDARLGAVGVLSGFWASVGGFVTFLVNLGDACGKLVCPQGYFTPDYACVTSLAQAKMPHPVSPGMVQDLYETPFCQAALNLSQTLWKGAYAGGAFCKERASCIFNNTQVQHCFNGLATVGEQVVERVQGHCLSPWTSFLAWKLPLGVLFGTFGVGFVREYQEEIGVSIQAGRLFLQDRMLVQRIPRMVAGLPALRHLSTVWLASFGSQQRSHLAKLATESFRGVEMNLFDHVGFEEEV